MRNFTEEQQMFRDAYRKFLESEVQPHMPRFREAGIVDREIFKKAGDQGFLMIWPDEKYGGMGDRSREKTCLRFIWLATRMMLSFSRFKFASRTYSSAR